MQEVKNKIQQWRDKSDGHKWVMQIVDGYVRPSGCNMKHYYSKKDNYEMEEALYVIIGGILYVHPPSDSFNHDRFITDARSFGVSVQCAGHLSLGKNGKIRYVNIDSGHYQPTKQDLIWALEFFKARGALKSNWVGEARGGQIIGHEQI